MIYTIYVALSTSDTFIRCKLTGRRTQTGSDEIPRVILLKRRLLCSLRAITAGMVKDDTMVATLTAAVTKVKALRNAAQLTS